MIYDSERDRYRPGHTHKPGNFIARTRPANRNAGHIYIFTVRKAAAYMY